MKEYRKQNYTLRGQREDSPWATLLPHRVQVTTRMVTIIRTYVKYIIIVYITKIITISTVNFALLTCEINLSNHALYVLH